MVYSSTTLSLAALETLVHIKPPERDNYVAFRFEFDASLSESVLPEMLPAEWRAEPPGLGPAAFGDRWVREGRSAILAVPSVIIPHETNYLLNPLHSDFPKIKIGKGQPFSFDPRLVPTSKKTSKR